MPDIHAVGHLRQRARRDAPDAEHPCHFDTMMAIDAAVAARCGAVTAGAMGCRVCRRFENIAAITFRDASTRRRTAPTGDHAGNAQVICTGLAPERRRYK